MYKKGIIWLYVFLFAGIMDMAFIIRGEQGLRYFSKPLIVLGLILFFLNTTAVIKGSLLRKCVTSALAFSLVGDILLFFPNLFLYGLGAFLMTHICYIIAFKLTQSQMISLKNVNFVKIFIYNLPIYIISAFVYFLIHNQLQSMKIPIIIYVLAIVLMATVARERFGRTNPSSFWQVFIGALLFLFSDATMALDHFFSPIPDADIINMGTYILSQLLIVMGIRSHLVAIKT